MKQFSILNGKAHVVELPEGAKFPRIETNQAVIPYGQDLTWDVNGGEKSYGMDETEWVALPPGNWQIVGMLPEVTEEQIIPLVERGSEPVYCYEQEYPEYVGDEWWYRDYQAKDDSDYKYSHYTALESLESAIMAEGYTFSNPLGKVKDFKKKYTGHDMFFADYMQKWYESQSRVLCRERTLILRRVDG